MDWTGCDIVEVVPGKMSGEFILKHSRVAADALLESYRLGEAAEVSLVKPIKPSFSSKCNILNWINPKLCWRSYPSQSATIKEVEDQARGECFVRPRRLTKVIRT